MKSKINDIPGEEDFEVPFMDDFLESVLKELTTDFDSHWEKLSPEKALPLRQNKQISDFMGVTEEMELAELFLLPFHSFTTTAEFNIRLNRKTPDYTMGIKWEILYYHQQAGSAPLYEADLLVTKRSIYEQGTETKEALQLNFQIQLAEFIKKYKQIELFEQVFDYNLSTRAFITFNKRRKQNVSAESYPITTSVDRFSEKAAQTAVSDSKERVRVIRIKLRDYWLKWAAVAHRAEFNFDYLAALRPIEMRFYELTQLLRFRNSEKPVNELKTAPLKITYGEFSSLMPLPRLKSHETVEKQMNDLCSSHLNRSYLKNFFIKPINRKGKFSDALLTFTF